VWINWHLKQKLYSLRPLGSVNIFFFFNKSQSWISFFFQKSIVNIIFLLKSQSWILFLFFKINHECHFFSPKVNCEYHFFFKSQSWISYLGLHNAHPLLALKISRKKLVRVYNAHGLLKKIVVGNARIKYQSYIFFSPFSMFHLLGEFKNHLSLFIFNKVAKY
jgi:hypothetical protein